MKRDTERKITVEDLLRFKRAERPPEEFWATFEAEIRTKQLSAIVSRRPWWDRFSWVSAALSRHQLSIGSAAAIALAFAGYRYVGAPREAVAAPQVALAKPVAVTHAVVAAAPAVEAPVPVAPPQIGRTAAARESVEVAADDAAPAPGPVVISTASHITQAPAAAAADGATRAPFADGIAITLADFREPASDYARPAVFGSDREFERSIAPAHQSLSQEPLATMDPAAERRARLLAPALGSAREVVSDWMRQRASSDDRMYESMDRGSNDDRMLVGFRF
jgi:hypothetical protein